jgi:hypothetical protein
MEGLPCDMQVFFIVNYQKNGRKEFLAYFIMGSLYLNYILMPLGIKYL